MTVDPRVAPRPASLVRLQRPRRSGPRRGLGGVAAAHGVLHRHLDLHRLQGLRGGLQGVERHPRRRLHHARQLVRQHRRAGREHLAARRVHRAAKPSAPRVDLGMPGVRPAERVPRRRRADRVPLADVLRRLQALHQRRLPRRLPDRGAVPDRVRHGRRAGRHLQRLRLLRAGLPVRRDRPPDR